MAAPTRVGLLGLGNMGGHMARRLASAGHAVTGYDVDAARAQSLAPHGVAPADSPAAARACDVLLSSLPDPAAVRVAYLGGNGAVEAVRAGMTLVDVSTIDPGTWREVSAAAP